MRPDENERIKKSISELKGPALAKYIWDYYKFHILLAVLAVVLITGFILGRINKKNSVLNVVTVNISVNDTLKTGLCDEYISFTGADPHKNEVTLITGLYISKEPNDLSAAYTSMMKLMAMMEAKQVDVIIADKKAMKIITDNGYLRNKEDISQLDISDMGYDAPVYAGIAANTPRPEDSQKYLDYIRIRN